MKHDLIFETGHTIHPHAICSIPKDKALIAVHSITSMQYKTRRAEVHKEQVALHSIPVLLSESNVKIYSIASKAGFL